MGRGNPTPDNPNCLLMAPLAWVARFVITSGWSVLAIDLILAKPAMSPPPPARPKNR
jgi:hypothetical protein